LLGDLSHWSCFFWQGQYKNGFSLRIALSDDRAGMIFCNFSANSQAHSCSVVSIFWIDFFERFEGFFYAYPIVFNRNLPLVIHGSLAVYTYPGWGVIFTEL